MPDLTAPGLPVLGLDADDTLWENQVRFAAVEDNFCGLVAPWVEAEAARVALLDTGRAYIRHHGYGVNSFILSMVDTGIQLSAGSITADELGLILSWGHDLIDSPVELLPDVADTLAELADTHRLLLITKGNPTDQLKKVTDSGLAGHLWQVEVVAEKDPASYATVLERHGVDPTRFLMVGNSVRSDVLPVLAIGGRAVHVPHGLSSALEEADCPELDGFDVPVLDRLADLPGLLADWPGPARDDPA